MWKKTSKKYIKVIITIVICCLLVGVISYISSNNVLNPQNLTSEVLATQTPIPTSSPTPMPTPSPTPTPTPSPTPTPTPSPSPSPTPTPSPKPTPTPSPKPTPTASPAPTSSSTPMLTPTPETKYVAITFDDGPTTTNAQQIMDAVEAYNGHVTFFSVGNRVENNKESILDIHKRGHEIGNHSWDHPKLTQISYSSIEWQLKTTSKAIFDITGEYPRYMRPPYGASNETVRKVISDLDMIPMFWTVDTLDWKYRDAEVVCNAIMKETKNGSVVLLHDIHKTSVEGFILALPKLAEKGYQFVTVSQLEEMNIPQ